MRRSRLRSFGMPQAGLSCSSRTINVSTWAASCLAYRTAGAIDQCRRATVVVRPKNFVARLARDAELWAQPRHFRPSSRRATNFSRSSVGYTHLPGRVALFAKGAIVYSIRLGVTSADVC